MPEELLAEIRANGFVEALRDHRRRATLALIRRRRAVHSIQQAIREWLNSTLHQCAVCMDNIAWVDMKSVIQWKYCHRACRPCIEQYVTLAVQEGRLHIPCLGIGCKNLLSDSDIAQYASTEALKNQMENRRAVYSRRVAALECGSESDSGFAEFCQEHCRCCPQCEVIIFRSEGCNHIVCRCGSHFDWEKTQGVKIVPRFKQTVNPSNILSASTMLQGSSEESLNPSVTNAAQSDAHPLASGYGGEDQSLGLLVPADEPASFVASMSGRSARVDAIRPQEFSTIAARPWNLAPQNDSEADEQLAAALALSMEFLLDHPPRAQVAVVQGGTIVPA